MVTTEDFSKMYFYIGIFSLIIFLIISLINYNNEIKFIICCILMLISNFMLIISGIFKKISIIEERMCIYE